MINRYNLIKREKARRKYPQPLRPQLGMCVCGERMAWVGDEMEGKEFWLGNARGRDGKRRHRGRQRDVVWRREVKSNMFLFVPNHLLLVVLFWWSMPLFERTLRWNKGLCRRTNVVYVLVLCVGVGSGGVLGACPDPELLFWCLFAQNRPWL